MSIRKIIYFIFSFIVAIEFTFGQSHSFFDVNLKREIFISADQKPSFPGGVEVLKNFVRKNVRYPKEAEANGIEEVVLITMVVDSDGTIFSPVIEGGSKQSGFDTEALRLISIMPKWNPGYNNGKPVAVQVSCPIQFSLNSMSHGSLSTLYENSYENGMLLLHDGNYFEAIIMFDTVIVKTPKFKNAYYNRGVAKFQLHDTLGACQDWKSMLNLGDSSVLSTYRKYCSDYSNETVLKKDTTLKTVELHGNEKIKILNSNYIRRQDSIASAFRGPRQEFYFQISVLMPTGTYGDDFKVNSSEPAHIAFRKSMQGDLGGFNSKQGYEIEAGGYFYFNKRPVPANGGIRITFLGFSTNAFRWYKDGDFIFNNAVYSNMNSYSIKIGPCLRNLFLNHSAIRYYYQICLAINNHAQWIYDDHTITYENGYRFTPTDHAEYLSHSGTGIKHELGIVFSYQNFMIGAAYNFGTVSYNDIQFKRDLKLIVDQYSSFQNSYQYVTTIFYQTDKRFSADAPTGYFLFSLAYKF